MNPKRFQTVGLSVVAVILLLGASKVRSQDRWPAQMASIDQYLMPDRSAEIALAQSAAPKAIAHDATVLVLGPKGYDVAIKGRNGFTCLVERAWMNPFDNPEFWNPKVRGPICYNAPATRSILPYTLNRTNMVLAGLTKAQLLEKIKRQVAQDELPAPEPGAMSYMLSKDSNLGDDVGHWYPHLMFSIPNADGASWGANVPGSPVIFSAQYTNMPEPEAIFMVVVAKWSDGTLASYATR